MFALFAGDSYYPVGGWRDFKGVFPILDDAATEGNRLISNDVCHDWWHVVDLATLKIVKESGG